MLKKNKINKKIKYFIDLIHCLFYLDDCYNFTIKFS